MLIQVKDELNDLDLSLTHITKVIEEKTSAYPNFKTYVVIYFAGGENATLKGWTLEQWRNFKKTINQ
jgi:hypothetical protein